MSSLDTRNDIYLSAEGDDLAREELNPVVTRYALVGSRDVLEVGCGYGRNLVALAELEGMRVSGCDVSEEELDKARLRLAAAGHSGVALDLQTDPKRLPYPDRSFDAVVLWQVLEHVFTDDEKQGVLDEVARVCRPGAIIIIETPNLLFPFDYHDTGLPLVHWLLPTACRRALARMLRSDDFYPSQYISLPGLERMLRSAAGEAHTGVTRVSTVYFETGYSDIFRHLGGTRIGWKRAFFRLYFPLYLLLRLVGRSGSSTT